MDGSTDTGEPSFSGDNNCCVIGGKKIDYAIGIYFVLLLFLFTICYTSYICKRIIRSRLPPPTTTSDSGGDYHILGLPSGLSDDVISTYPTFVYSEAVMTRKGDNETDTNTRLINNYGSGCSICLSDYNQSEVLCLLPECAHLFHLSCIDTWLKVQPTCPVCRKSLDLSHKGRI